MLCGTKPRPTPGPPLLPGTVNGYNFNYFLDSGSGVCLIHEVTIDKLQLKLDIRPSSLRIQGVSGTVMAVKGEADILFKWGNTTMVHPFVILGGPKAIPGSLLLGWDWLQESDVVIHPKQNIVYFGNDIYKLLVPGAVCNSNHERLAATLTTAKSQPQDPLPPQMLPIVLAKPSKDREPIHLLYHGDIYRKDLRKFVSKQELATLVKDRESKANHTIKQLIDSNQVAKNQIKSSFCFKREVECIPAFSAAKVRVHVKIRMDGEVKLKGSFLVHPLLMNINGLTVAPGLYNFTNGQSCLILMNTTPSPIDISKRRKICDVEFIVPEIEVKDLPHRFTCATTAEGTGRDLASETVEAALTHCPSPFPEAGNWLRRVFQDNLAALPSEERPLGKTSLLEHRIDLVDNARPFKIPAYRIPHSRKALVSKEIKAMLESGIIEESTSPYSSPLLLVPKANGEYRPCIDFRRLNDSTITEIFPLPSIKSLLYEVNRGTKILSSIDLQQGYFQVPLAEDCRHLTGFTTHEGHYHFCRTPMGLKNAPITFSRLMSMLLQDKMGDGIFVYLDDILITSETVDEHKRKLNIVLGRLAEAGLTIKPSKCRFFQKKLVFLGHELSGEGMRPNQLKIRAVQEFPVPKNSKELKSFLGLANYFRDYVKDYGSICAPLNELLRKSVKFLWNNDHELSFNALKAALTSAPVLAFPDYSMPFEVHTDASMVGIGASLIQRINGSPKPIAYASRKLNSAEINYSTTDREMLAIAWALKNWREVIQGYPITVFTDHAPLVNTLKPTHRDPHGRRARYQVTLGEFDVTIKYVKGKDNAVPDALSRVTTGRDGERLDESSLDPNSLPPSMTNHGTSGGGISRTCALFPTPGGPLEPLSREDIARELRESPVYGPIVRALEEGSDVTRVAHIPTHEFSLQEGLLIRISKPKNIRGRIMKSSTTIVLPDSCINKVLAWAHEGNAHQGYYKTLNFIRARYFFPRMASVVSKHVKACKVCPLYKGKVTQHPCGTYDVPKRPFERVFYDVLSLPTSHFGSQYLLVFIDNFSRYTELVVIKDKKAETIAKAFHDSVICRHGCPSILISDNGPEVFNEIMSKLCKFYNIARPRILPRRPEANSYCERVNRTILNSIRTLTQDQKDTWCENVPTLQSTINGSFHKALTDSPDFLIFGRDKRLPWEMLHSSLYPQYTLDTPESLFRYQQRAFQLFRELEVENQNKARELQAAKPQPEPFTMGQQVFHQIEKRGVIRGKLQPSFEGPFRVLRFRKNGVVCRCLQSNEEKTFHPDTLKAADKFYGMSRT